MERKQIAFPVTNEEHAKIKELAARERRSIKQLFLDLLDKVYPGWNKDEHKTKTG